MVAQLHGALASMSACAVSACWKDACGHKCVPGSSCAIDIITGSTC